MSNKIKDLWDYVQKTNYNAVFSLDSITAWGFDWASFNSYFLIEPQPLEWYFEKYDRDEVNLNKDIFKYCIDVSDNPEYVKKFIHQNKEHFDMATEVLLYCPYLKYKVIGITNAAIPHIKNN